VAVGRSVSRARDEAETQGRGRGPIIRSPPPPEKSPLANNLPAKRSLGRDGFLPVNYRPGKIFPGEGRSYNRKTFYGAGDILIRGRHINSVIISTRGGFFMGKHFNVTPGVRVVDTVAFIYADSERLSERASVVMAAHNALHCAVIIIIVVVVISIRPNAICCCCCWQNIKPWSASSTDNAYVAI